MLAKLDWPGGKRRKTRSPGKVMPMLGWPVLLLWLWLCGAGCKNKSQAGPPAPPEVQVVSVQQKNVPIYHEWVGTLQAEVNATISAQVSGYLQSRDYQEGSIVTNGQVLFQLQKGPFEAALARAQAELQTAEARKGKTALDVQRYTPLAASEAISKQELDNAIQADKAAAAQIDSAQAAVEEARLNLGFATIRAPVDGIAGLARAQVGNLIGPNSGPLTTVTKINPIRAEFSLSQQLMTQLQQRMLAGGKVLRSNQGYQGPPLELLLATGSTYAQKGYIRFADNQVDIKTGTIRVVGEFPNPEGLLVPGMFVRVRALLETQTNALLVPQRAVTDLQGRSLVALVGPDNKVNIRPVSTGERVGPDWVIQGPVKPGDRVVAEGIQKVRDGAVVNPVPLAKGQAAAPAGAPAQTN